MDEIIEKLTVFPNLSEAINNTNFTDNSIFTFISLISKISQNNSDACKNILNSFLQSKFVRDHISTFLRDLPEKVIRNNMSENEMKDQAQILKECLCLFNECLYQFRSHSKSLPVDDLKTTIEVLIPNTKFKPHQGSLKPDVEKLKKDFLTIYLEDLKKLEEKNSQKYNQFDKFNNNENVIIDYKDAELILTEREIWENRNPILQAHRKMGTYESWNRYFNTLFYLVREDCYRSLRQSIAAITQNFQIDLKRQRNLTNIYYYKSVMIENLEILSTGIIMTLSFELLQKRVSWNKRMLMGSLVIITPEDFNKFLLGIIVENPDKFSRNRKDKKHKNSNNNKNRFTCKITLAENNFEQFSDFMKVTSVKKSSTNFYHMFESKAYYESYRHILKRIQTIDTRSLPFEDIIINYTPSTNMVPSYINRNSSTISHGISNYKIFSELWPPALVSKLDETQLAALKHGLRNKIAIIQGPPGTGKTYVGGILTELLLKNVSQNNPILIVCYTNHALDQFLSHILKFESNIVRIGGQCKEENIIPYSIANLRKKMDRYYFLNSNIKQRISQISREINRVTNTFNKTSVLDYQNCSDNYPEVIKKILDQFWEILNENKIIIKKNNIHTKYNSQIYAAWINKNNLSFLLNNLQKDGLMSAHNKDIISDFFRSFYQDQKEIIPQSENTGNINLNLENLNKLEYFESEEDEDEYNENTIENFERILIEDEFIDQDINFIDIDSDLNDLKIDDDDSEIYNYNPNYIDLEKFCRSNLNPWLVSHRDKICIIQSMKMNFLNAKIGTLRNHFEDYKKILNSKKEMENLDDIKLIKAKRIVGMTTTGCAKYSSILEQVNFQTIIIEEAAEVLESHITALLTKNVKHMILIGDHQQLRPNPFNYEMVTKYNFDLSLFERLINNRVPYAALGYQRRMRPEFADFVRLIYSKKYIDHADTFNRPNIKGINSNIYFIDHRQEEEQNQSLASKSNIFEARFITHLTRYFTQQGYEGKQITILATYIAQVLVIREELKKMKLLDVRVCSVDNYQGEENDIILLSLVRSNKENQIGFLKTFNRICVAFSRAKLGFYVFGNFECILRGQIILKNKKNISTNPDDEKLLWSQLYELAKSKNIISDSLRFQCQKHKKITYVKSSEDFKNIPEGGCKEICRERMSCGHVCEFFCHNFQHDIKLCKKPCPRTLSCGHNCSLRCNEECGICKKRIETILPKCGHKVEIFCYEDPSLIKCLNRKKCRLKCGHIKQIECYKVNLLMEKVLDINDSELNCYEDVEVVLGCGHKKVKNCSMKTEDVKCDAKCQILLPCNHICKGTCHDCLEGTLHIPCNEICKKILICSHECKQDCSLPCLCSNEKCDNICDHGFCNDPCSIPCVKCNEPCSVKCKHHQCKKLCHEMCDYICNERCQRKQKCGHQCMGICGEKCPNICKICDPNNNAFQIYFGTEDEEEALFFKLDCGHIFEVDGLDKYFHGINNTYSGAIQMKTCPNKCKEAIKNGNRYRNLLKQTFSDFQAVKKKMMDAYGDSSLYNKVEKLFTEFINKLSSTEKTKNYTSIKYVSKLNDLNKNNYSHLLTMYNIGCNLRMLYEIEKFEEIGNQNIQCIDKNFLKNLNVIRNYFNSHPSKIYTNDFFKNLNSKIKALFYYVKFLEYKIDPKFIKIITGNKFLLDQIILASLEAKFQMIEKDEMMNVVNAAGGTWYRCPDGHLYSVGECGRPMEEIFCPDCNKKIGGRDHIPNQGNILANLI